MDGATEGAAATPNVFFVPTASAASAEAERVAHALLEAFCDGRPVSAFACKCTLVWLLRCLRCRRVPRFSDVRVLDLSLQAWCAPPATRPPPFTCRACRMLDTDHALCSDAFELPELCRIYRVDCAALPSADTCWAADIARAAGDDLTTVGRLETPIQ